MDAYVSRTKTSHTYNEETAREVAVAILSTYFDLFVGLDKKMESLLSDNRRCELGGRFGIERPTFDRIIQVLSNNPLVEEAIIYGSHAKGTHKPGSDIDLVLKGEQLNLQELNRISLDLDDLLTPHIFDLSIYQQIQDADLLSHIKRVGKTIYRKES